MRESQVTVSGNWEGLIRRRLQHLQSRSVYALQHWQSAHAELLRERGVLGGAFPLQSDCANEHKVVKRECSGLLRARKRMLWWRLDNAEGPQRMRRRLELDGQEMAKVIRMCDWEWTVG